MAAPPRAIAANATPTEITRGGGVTTVYLQNGSDRVACRIDVAASAPSASSAGPMIAPGAWAKVAGLVTADKIWAWTSGAAGDVAAVLVQEG